MWDAFTTSVLAVAIGEMGDKTQLLSLVLAAKHASAPIAIILGSTLGMVLANAPVIWLGEHVLKRVPLRAVRIAAAVIFGLLGTGVLLFGLPQF